jgi:adenine-specific DNA-methyltransferase
VVYTPRPLADAIVHALGDDGRAKWLEPCVGGGVFLQALSNLGVPAERIRGLDVEIASEPFDSFARTIRGRDFLSWSLKTRERFRRVVANPPFLALNRLPADVQRAALTVRMPGGGTVPLGANCWLAFLCASISLLERNGSLGFVLPAAWEYSDYGAQLRRVVPRAFEHTEVHRSQNPLFSTVQDGSTVLIARGYRGGIGSRRGVTLRLSHPSGEGLIEAVRTSKPTPSSSNAVLTPIGNKVLFGSSGLAKPRKTGTETWQRLLDVLEIRIGGVTGDARYFLLTEEERAKRGLPQSALRPVLSKASHLVGGRVTEEAWQKLRDDGHRVWLFDPPPSQLTHEAVRAYLELPSSDGGCRRNAFKVRRREPWFRTPIQPAIDGFMSGMSSWGPWVVFREMPRLAATNTLYLVRFLKGNSPDERAAWAMWLLTTEASSRLRRIGRRYADGLVKFEPGDLGRLMVRTPPRTENAYAKYIVAVGKMLDGDVPGCRKIADTFFGH